MTGRSQVLAVLILVGLCSCPFAQAASPPVITTQPTNTTILAGDTKALHVVAQGEPVPSYQWYFNGAPIPGSVNSFHSIYGAITPHQGEYYATLSNELGSVTSEVAFVTVITNPPAILSQPTNISVTVGQPATFTVNATGRPPPSYTWYFNEANKLIFATKTVTFLSAQETHSGTYTVVLSNSVASITSAPIVLTVSPLPLVTLQPTNQTLIEADPLTLNVAAAGRVPLYYQWFFENVPLASATATNFTVASARLGNSGNYYCVISNSAGTATSRVATVTVTPAPTHAGALDVFYKPNTNGWDVTDLILLENDKLFVAGSLTDAGVRRLHADGTIDSTFASNRFTFEKIALEPDGSILALSGNRLTRFDTAGVRDTNFAPASIDLPNPIRDFGVQPEGGIVFVGYDSFAPLNYLGRLLPDGSLDRFFRTFEPIQVDGGVGGGNRGEIKVLEVLANGGFVFPALALQRRHPNGATDSTFSSTDWQLGSQITSIVPTRDQRGFFIIGTFTNIGSAVRKSFARLDNSGALDPTFVPPTNMPVWVTAAAVQLDGKVVIAGYGAAGSNSVIRLNADGSVDDSFSPAWLGVSAAVNAVAIQSDGKILVGGTFIRANGRRIHGLARLHGDPPASPEILAEPQDTIAIVGQKVSLRATVRAFGNVAYQWYRNDGLVATETEPHLHLQSVTSSDAGDYRLVVATSYGSVTSQVARLTVDSNTNTAGIVALDFAPNIDGAVYALESTPDGKFIVSGNFNRVDGVPRPGIARINADGSLDTTFNPPETAPRDFLRYVRALAVTAEGAVYIGGAFTNVGGVKRQLIARLHNNGSLDESFDPGHALHGADEQVNAIALLPNSRVLAAGSFAYTSNYFYGGTVARFHSDGTVDTNFAPTVRGTARCLSVLESNKVLIGGSLQSRLSSSSAVAYRVLENGRDDAAFQGGFACELRLGIAHSMRVLADGKVLVGGGFPIPSTNRHWAVRLLANGAIDRSFNPLPSLDTCSWIADAGCGKVLVGGSFRSVDGQPHRNLARLNADGTLDTTFDSQPFDGAVRTGLMLPNGDTIVAGEFWTAKGVARPHIARISNGPNELPSFATQPVTQSIAEGLSATLHAELLCSFPPPTLQWQFNGTNLAGETNLSLNLVNTQVRHDGSYRLVISNAVGSVTSSVAQITVLRAPRVPGAPEIESTSIFTSNSLIRCLHPLPDGKLLVGGSFSNLFDAPHRGLVRLNADASYDHTFNYANDGLVRAVAVLENGKIMVNEWVLSSGSDNSRLLRLHPDGALDTTFRPFPHFEDWTESANGLRAIVLAGQRIHTTMHGFITGFPTTAVYFAGSIHTFAVQPDGKLLVGGEFTRIGNVARTNLARLEKTDGAVDRAFAPLAGTINALAIQPDGRIVVGGQFASAGGLIRRGVARFHGDGTLDEGFSPQPGIGGTFASVRAVALQSDGKVIIGGSFNSYDGVPCNNIARLNADGTLDQTFQPGTGIGGTNAFLNVVTLAEDGGIFVGGRFSAFNGLPRHSFARAYNNPKLLNFSRGRDVTSFSFLSLLDRTYVLEARGVDDDAPWSHVQSLVGDGSIKTVTYPNATSDAVLYRLRME